MADLTPRTRSESFLNGEDLEPITRREHFYSGRENELPEGHQEPETREEWFIQKYREAGDVTVESLSITENGTYTAPSGKAYSPVSVNVPLPSNAYLLKSIENVNIATFTDGTDNFLKSLEVAIEPQQDLHGYDAPWVWGAGKNFIDYSAQHNTTVGVSYTDNPYSGEIKVDYVGGIIQHQLVLSVPNVDKLKGQRVTLSVDSVVPSNARMNDWRIFLLTYINGGSESIVVTLSSNTLKKDVAIPDNITEMRLLLRMSQGESSSLQSGDYVTFNKIQLELGGDKTSYAPYSNICPISGWDECNVTVADDLENPTVSNVYTLDLDGTRYGGKLDVVNGVLTVDRAYVDLGTLNWSMSPSTAHAFYASLSSSLNYALGEDVVILCSNYPFAGTSTIGYYEENKLTCYRRLEETMPSEFYIQDNAYSDATTFKTAMNGVQLVYELATPQTIQLSPTIIKSLQGENNLFASTGEIDFLQYWGR